MKARPNSETIFDQLKEVVAGGVNSPTRAFSGMGVLPLIIESGKNDEIIDVDGNKYIDLNMAWGSLLLGHVHPKVIDSAKSQIDKGSSFGITTPIELQFALEMQKCVPSLERMRVVASGTEATMTAIRLARGFTGRKSFIKFNGHYHGHSDAFLVKAGSGVSHHFEDASSKGVPQEVVQHSFSLPFNDSHAFVECMKEHGESIAAIILEPIAGNMGVVAAKEEFIELIFKTAKTYGALVIFDEVITGFRLGKGGAQSYYGVTPDLSTYSKIVGGGFPIGIVGGRKEIMEMLAPNGPVYQAGTLSGNPTALHGGHAVLKELQKEGFYDELEEKMSLFLDPIEEKVKSSAYPLCLNRAGSMFTLFFGIKKAESFEDVCGLNRGIFIEFFQFMLEKGIYISPSPFEASFISSAHTVEHLLYAQQSILEFIDSLNAKVVSSEMVARTT